MKKDEEKKCSCVIAPSMMVQTIDSIAFLERICPEAAEPLRAELERTCPKHPRSQA
jgi:hypothetical protein